MTGIEKIVLDTSVIIDCAISKMIEEGGLSGVEVIIPAAALDELQAQASKGRSEGIIGLQEIKRIRELGQSAGIKIRFAGQRPTLEDIKLARGGRIDALIRDVAKSEGAILYTSDFVQHLVGEAEGIPTHYITKEKGLGRLKFEDFMTYDTMSLHLKRGTPPLAKRGGAGSFVLMRLREEPMTHEEIDQVIKDILDRAHRSSDASIEIAREGAMVVQIGQYRVAITRPPFSDDYEVTIVKPVVKLTLDDYRLSSKLLERLAKRAEGVLIAGPPGSGKTTFASCLADYYTGLGKIVKTLESPRDLQVRPEVTQYGPLEGDFEKAAELLLLVRPDYTIFDEMRREKDFKIYADMRLAGVGMVGVVHASSPIDAIQRFVSRVELGMLPHVVDTVIFIKNGRVERVYELSLTIKVPTGMRDEGLARPVVEITDFEDGELIYEMYTFGEEVVTVPIRVEPREGLESLDELRAMVRGLLGELVGVTDVDVEPEGINSIRLLVDQRHLPKVLGRRGETVRRLERRLKMKINVEPRILSTGRPVKTEVSEVGNSLEVRVEGVGSVKRVSLYSDGRYLFTATTGKVGKVRISKSSQNGKLLLREVLAGREITCIVHD
ncbi:MAG: PINc/VapC family ATPase [Aigarchaeota archaeon]|nr:PINc/VapC family ATPase [Aigarchaeota archaeon]MDW8092165.1 PINc/VapC family ATPase [Nitrososphaerota archaeon]